MTKDGVATTADGLGDGWETSRHGDLVILDELMPLDLQQLSLALHMEGLEGGFTQQHPVGFLGMYCTRVSELRMVHYKYILHKYTNTLMSDLEQLLFPVTPPETLHLRRA